MKLLLPLLLIFIGCQSNNEDDIITTIKLGEKSAKMIQAQNRFGLKLFKQANTESQNSGNVMVSPLSVSQALSMTYNGANGNTKDEFEQLLDYSGLTTNEINNNNQNLVDALVNHDSKVEFSVANSIWYRNDRTVREEFKRVNRDFYNAEIEALDFSQSENVKNRINGWVNEKTKTKIPTIIDKVSAESFLFLVNAIYFKADWKFQFDKKATTNRPFDAGEALLVPTMKIEGGFNYFANETFEAVELPYGGEKFSMFLILPESGTNMNEFIEDLELADLEVAYEKLKKRNLNIYLPRFEFEYKNELKEELKELGLNQAFSLGADFSKMTDDRVHVSKVLHKTYIKTDEEGSEAAAVTAVEMIITSVDPSNPEVRFNRPFMFVIREKDTQSNLFIGKVINPTLKN